MGKSRAPQNHLFRAIIPRETYDEANQNNEIKSPASVFKTWGIPKQESDAWPQFGTRGQEDDVKEVTITILDSEWHGSIHPVGIIWFTDDVKLLYSRWYQVNITKKIS